MKVGYLDLPRQFQDEALFEEVKKVFARGQFILGSEVERFEAAFADLCGTRFALGLNSGTDALFLALKALGIGPGTKSSPCPTVSWPRLGRLRQRTRNPFS